MSLAKEAAEIRHRIACVREGRKDGWGDPHSLSNLVMCTRNRANEASELIAAIEADADNRNLFRDDQVLCELEHEHRDFIAAFDEADAFVTARKGARHTTCNDSHKRP